MNKLSNNREIQKNELARKTKLTLVNVYIDRMAIPFFIQLEHNEQGNAILPYETQNQLLRAAHQH